MMNFVFSVKDEVGTLKVTNKNKPLPATTIECDAYKDGKIDNDKVLKAVESWLGALELSETEYQVFVQLH